MSQGRIKEIDLLRGFAALAVIAIHVTTGYLTNRYGAFINQACRFAVPLFILVSGFVLYNPEKQISGIKGYLSFASKRLNKIVIPYVIWSAAYTVYQYATFPVNLSTGQWFQKLLTNVLNGTASGHLYFIIIIIQLYLIFPLLSWFMQKAKVLTVSIAFIVSMGIHLGLYFPEAIHLPKIGGGFSYATLCLTWVFYFVFGMFFKTYYDGFIKQMKNWHTVLLFFLFAGSLALMLYDNYKLSPKIIGVMKPATMLYTLSVFLFLSALFAKFKDLKGSIMKVWEGFSDQSFFIYFVHTFVIFGLRAIIKALNLTAFMSLTRGLIIMLVLTAASSYVLAWMVSKLRIAPLLGAGYMPKKKIT